MVKSQLISNSYEKLTSHSFEESVWAVVQLEGRDKLLIGCIYRSSNADDHNNTQMFNILGRVSVENFYLVTYGLLAKKIGIPKYYQGRYEEMRDYLSQLPWQIDQNQNLSEIWNLFQNKITIATHHFIIPVHKPGIKKGRVGAIVIQLWPSNTNKVPGINTIKIGLQRSGTIIYKLETVQLHKLNRQRDYMERK